MKTSVNHNATFGTIQKLIGSLLLSTISMTSMASADAQKNQAQWYQADMIVFLNEQSMNGSEKWPEITAHPQPTNAIKLKSYKSGSDNNTSSDLESFLNRPEKKPVIDLERDAFVSLPYPSHLLQKESSKLSKNGSYRILAQKAWLMPVKEGESTLPVSVQTYNTQSETPSMLEGTVTVSSSRFLHVDVNLWYSELAWEALAKNGGDLQSTPESQQKPEVTEVNKTVRLVTTPGGQSMEITRNFQLQESRKITNSEEIQYLDSPVIGVLFKLTPYQRPDQPLMPEVTTDQEEKPELGILPGIVDQKDG